MSAPTTQRNILDVFTKIIHTLECPVCYNYVESPIFQCNEGHIICNRCKEKINNCPSCGASLSCKIRVRILEDISEQMIFPCKNDSCDQVLSLPDLRCHEDSCEYANADSGRVTEKNANSQNYYSSLLSHVEAHLSPFFITNAGKALIHQETQTDKVKTSGVSNGPYILSGTMHSVRSKEDISAQNEFLGVVSKSSGTLENSFQNFGLNYFLKERLFSTSNDSLKILNGMNNMSNCSSDSSECSSQTDDNVIVISDVLSESFNSNVQDVLKQSTYQMKDKCSVRDEAESDGSESKIEDFPESLRSLYLNNQNEDMSLLQSRNSFAQLLKAITTTTENNGSNSTLNSVDDIDSSQHESNLEDSSTPMSDKFSENMRRLFGNNKLLETFNIGKNIPPKNTSNIKSHKYILKKKSSVVNPFDFNGLVDNSINSLAQTMASDTDIENSIN